MKLLLLLLISFFVDEKPFEVHPIHLSVINMEYTDNKEFDVLIRVFTDDFEAIINRDYSKNLKLTEKSKNSEIFIDKYIKDNLKIYLNNKLVSEKLNISSVNHNIKNNTTEILYKFKYKVPNKVKIENRLFHAYFRDQKNLFIFTCGKTQEAIKFTNSKTEVEFKLK